MSGPRPPSGVRAPNPSPLRHDPPLQVGRGNLWAGPRPETGRSGDMADAEGSSQRASSLQQQESSSPGQLPKGGGA